MSHNVKVRTIRPHDTTDGMKAPGEQYERRAADADQLVKLGVVAIAIARPPAKPKARKRK